MWLNPCFIKAAALTGATVLKGDSVTFGQSLLQLSKHLLVPILSEPDHLCQKNGFYLQILKSE